MSDISRVALFGKLNPSATRRSNATVFCKLRGNPYVELEHWLAQLVRSRTSTSGVIRDAGLTSRPSPTTSPVRSTGCRAARRRFPICAEPIVNAVERAWVYATLKYGDHRSEPVTCWWRCSSRTHCAMRWWAFRASSTGSTPSGWPTIC